MYGHRFGRFGLSTLCSFGSWVGGRGGGLCALAAVWHVRAISAPLTCFLRRAGAQHLAMHSQPGTHSGHSGASQRPSATCSLPAMAVVRLPKCPSPALAMSYPLQPPRHRNTLQRRILLVNHLCRAVE